MSLSAVFESFGYFFGFFWTINVLVIVLFIQSSHAYSLGAPDAGCKRMTPGMWFLAIFYDFLEIFGICYNL